MNINHKKMCWFLVQDKGLFVQKQTNELPDNVEPDIVSLDLLPHFSLGRHEGIDYCCAEWRLDRPIPETWHLLPLRDALSILNDGLFAMAVRAYSVIHWDRNHQYCGLCGGITRYEGKAFERRCIACHVSFFPRISPSIIVLIKKGTQLLMARSPHFLPGIYGLIAGFVDVGETLEDAVHREVMEEVGLKVKNLTYVGSQPWPFPDSLMIAFTADYDSGEIVIDNHEIEAAGWYDYDALPGRPSVSISVASRLIDGFVRDCSLKNT